MNIEIDEGDIVSQILIQDYKDMKTKNFRKGFGDKYTDIMIDALEKYMTYYLSPNEYKSVTGKEMLSVD